MEKQWMIADRCALNRHIQADNRYLRRIKATVAKLAEAVQNVIALTVPAVADTLETIRQNMIVLQYRFMGIQDRWAYAESYLKHARPLYRDYQDLLKSIADKRAARETLIVQRDALPVISVFKRRDLTAKIESMAEEIEELKTERNEIMRPFKKQDAKGMATLESEFSDTDKTIAALQKDAGRYSDELDAEKQRFDQVQKQTADVDQDEITAERLAIRPEKEKGAISRIRSSSANGFSFSTYENSLLNVDYKLDEEDLVQQFKMRQMWKRYEEQQRAPKRNKSRSRNLER